MRAAAPIGWLCVVIASCSLRNLDELESGFSAATGGGAGGTGGECSKGFDDCVPDDGIACETNVETSAGHCGRCKHDCLGGACKEGRCEPVALATARSAPFGIAVDATFVYWSEQLGSRTARVRKDGAGSPIDSSPFSGAPQGIAVDGAYVFVANSPANLVLRMALDGTAITTLDENAAYPVRLSLDATHVYWTSFDSGDVVRAPRDLSSSTVVASGGAALGIVLDGDFVYWTDANPIGQVLRAPKSGGQVDVVAGSLHAPHELAVGNGYLYWTEHGGDGSSGAVKAWRIGALGTPFQTLDEDAAGPEGIAVDEERVYWTNAETGQVWSLALEGGSRELLASGQRGPMLVAVDDDCVYWTNRGADQSNGGSVMKLAK